MKFLTLGVLLCLILEHGCVPLLADTLARERRYNALTVASQSYQLMYPGEAVPADEDALLAWFADWSTGCNPPALAEVE